MDRLLKNDRVFIIAVFGIWLILEIASVWHHEPWRDEMAVWMVAKYNSLHGILEEARIQAQPPLWYLIVKGMQQLAPSPLGMSLANLLFISLACFVVLKYGPFNRTPKVFLCFSYFLFYEYGTISRNYGLTVAVLFAVCALHKHRKKYWILMAFLLAIGCSIQIMNVVFAGCFLLIMAAEQLFCSRSDQVDGIRRLVASAFIIAAGMVGALFLTTPPAGSPWSLSAGQRWVFYNATGTLKTIWLSFVPIAEPRLHFWNSNILPDGRLMIVASVAILVLSTFSLVRKPLSVLFYVSGVTALLIFFCRFYHGFVRHHGYIFLIFIASYWIYQNYDEQKTAGYFRGLIGRPGGRHLSFFTAACFVNCCAVVVPVYFDWIYPFSASREVGRYLSESKLENCVLLGDVDFYVAPVAGWIDREMYYPAIGAFSKMVRWNDPNRKRIAEAEVHDNTTQAERIWQAGLELAAEKGRDVVLILNYPIDKVPIKEFPISVVLDESYYLYRIRFQQPDEDLRRIRAPAVDKISATVAQGGSADAR